MMLFAELGYHFAFLKYPQLTFSMNEQTRSLSNSRYVNIGTCIYYCFL